MLNTARLGSSWSVKNGRGEGRGSFKIMSEQARPLSFLELTVTLSAPYTNITVPWSKTFEAGSSVLLMQYWR